MPKVRGPFQKPWDFGSENNNKTHMLHGDTTDTTGVRKWQRYEIGHMPTNVRDLDVFLQPTGTVPDMWISTNQHVISHH